MSVPKLLKGQPLSTVDGRILILKLINPVNNNRRYGNYFVTNDFRGSYGYCTDIPLKTDLSVADFIYSANDSTTTLAK